MAQPKNTIAPGRADGYEIKEGAAAGAVSPGHLVKPSGDDFAVHGTAGGNAQKLFALEQDQQGKGIGDDYALNDPMRVGAFKTNEPVLAWLAASQTIAKGDALQSNGDGALAAWATGASPETDNVVAYAAEAVTTTGAAARILVEVA